jgi:hypothetical protein
MPVPIIRRQIPQSMVSLRPLSLDKEAAWLNQTGNSLELIVNEGTNSKKKTLNLNLLLFEYLYRIAEGGSQSYLAQECALAIDRFKDKLLAGSGAVDQGSAVQVFAIKDGRAIIQTLALEDGKIMVKLHD